MASVAAVLRASPHWQRRNGTDHMWACTCVMMKAMVTSELWALLGTAMHAVHSVLEHHRRRPDGRTLTPTPALTVTLNPPGAARARLSFALPDGDPILQPELCRLARRTALAFPRP